MTPSATPAQLAAVGFAALALGKTLDACEAVHVSLTQAEREAMTRAVGDWLRQRHGAATVEAAKRALSEEVLDAGEDASEELDAAVEAVQEALAASFAALDGQRADAIGAAHQAGLTAAREALAEAYGEAAVAAHWPGPARVC